MRNQIETRKRIRFCHKPIPNSSHFLDTATRQRKTPPFPRPLALPRPAPRSCPRAPLVRHGGRARCPHRAAAPRRGARLGILAPSPRAIRRSCGLFPWSSPVARPRCPAPVARSRRGRARCLAAGPPGSRRCAPWLGPVARPRARAPVAARTRPCRCPWRLVTAMLGRNRPWGFPTLPARHAAPGPHAKRPLAVESDSPFD